MVVELDGGAGARTTSAPEGLAPTPVPVVRSDQHPHCPALWVFRQVRLESPAGAPLLARLAHVAPLARSPDVAPHASWALHRAPKQSPPL